MSKYILTDVSIDFMGKKLFQIKATQSFGNVTEGDLGGYIEKESNLSQVYGDAWVYGNAQVSGNAQVYGNAQVSGNAQVYGDAWVYGDAQVYGDAWVYGDAQVSGNAWVYGNAWVSGDAWVYGNAQVSGNAQVYGDARVYGDAQVYGDAWVYGNAWVSGDAWVSAKKTFTRGWFIGGDNTDKITKLSHEQIGNTYWKSNYVLGDFEIKDIEEEKQVEQIEELTLEQVCERLGKNIKIIKN